jgi:hypothetical protein
MVTKLSLPGTTTRRPPPLHTWQRLLVGAALVMATAISAALIYFQPGTRTFTVLGSESRVPVTETAPALPPGTDMYYSWGQWKPLDQQP